MPILTIFLVSLWPFVNFLAVNFWEEPVFIRVAAVWLGFFAGMLVFQLFLARTVFRRMPQGAAVYASLLFVAFFSYSISTAVAHSIWGEYHLRTWSAMFVAVAVLGFPAARLSVAQKIAPVAALAMVLIPAAQVVAKALQRQAPAQILSRTPASEILVGVGDIAIKRSVYLIVHDGYPRDDTLAQLGYDNGPFIDDLRTRGFFVPPDGRSNYEATQFTVTSIFSMSAAGDAYANTSNEEVAQQFKRIENGDNALYRYFAGQGYSTGIIAMTAGNCSPDIDSCGRKARAFASLGEQEANLLLMTPLIKLADRLEFRNDWTYSIDFAAIMEHRDPRIPTFQYAHILDVHPPFIYDANCENDYTGNYEFNRYELDAAFHYALECSNRMLLRALDRILERDPEAIIVITADHGSDFIRHGVTENEAWTPAAFLERFAIFSAWRLPEGCRDLLYDSVSPANIFPIVLSCLTGNRVQRTSDASYFKAGGANGITHEEPVTIDLDRNTGLSVRAPLVEAGLLPQ